ncbi:MAG TPA: hypothetical protein VFE34_25575 [Dongiaceae bacterium]|nr:hypothetical protein [Dongiaceae bacterium]
MPGRLLLITVADQSTPMSHIRHILNIIGEEPIAAREEVEMIIAIFAFIALPVALFFIPMMLRGNWLSYYVGLVAVVLTIALGYQSRHGHSLNGFADTLSALYWAWLIAATGSGVLLGAIMRRDQSAA